MAGLLAPHDPVIIDLPSSLAAAWLTPMLQQAVRRSHRVAWWQEAADATRCVKKCYGERKPAKKLFSGGLRQRPTQACGTNVRDSVTVLVGGVRADLAVVGHSDDSTDDHPTQKQHDYYQPSPGRS